MMTKVMRLSRAMMSTLALSIAVFPANAWSRCEGVINTPQVILSSYCLKGAGNACTSLDMNLMFYALRNAWGEHTGFRLGYGLLDRERFMDFTRKTTGLRAFRYPLSEAGAARLVRVLEDVERGGTKFSSAILKIPEYALPSKTADVYALFNSLREHISLEKRESARDLIPRLLPGSAIGLNVRGYFDQDDVPTVKEEWYHYLIHKNEITAEWSIVKSNILTCILKGDDRLEG